MNRVLDAFAEWLKEILISFITGNLTGLFDSVNNSVGDVTNLVGQDPSAFSPAVFNLIRNISETVILPIAGIVLTFVACIELIHLVIDHNNLAHFETWFIFKWIFKTSCAVYLISNVFTITMAVFDVASHVIRSSGSLIAGSTQVNQSQLDAMTATLDSMDIGPLLGLAFSSMIVGITLRILSAFIFVIVYGRMIEIYMTVSLAPIPFSTFASREAGMMGKNYFRSIAALGFQGFLMMVCIGIYAVLVQSISFSSDITGSIWGVIGYTALLCFSLLKTSSLARSIFHAH